MANLYYPQMYGKLEVINKKIKGIFENIVRPSRNDWTVE